MLLGSEEVAEVLLNLRSAAPSNAGPLQSTGVSVSATSSSIAVQSTQLPTGGLIKPLWIPVNMSLPLKDDINKAGVLWKDWYPHFSDIEASKWDLEDVKFPLLICIFHHGNSENKRHGLHGYC